MSTQPLQPSPFTPDQFVPANAPHDEDMHAFIKKRPIELTEDLIEGRVESRLRRCRSPHRASPHRAFSEPPDFAVVVQDDDPMTPPNRPQSPASRDADRLRSPSRRKPSSRRPSNVRRSCSGIIPSRKSATRESSPACSPPRSPLRRWTPPALSSIPLFAPDDPMLPTTPPPRPQSYPFGVLPPHCWADRVPWTVPSPSTSPYPAHTPLPDSEHPA